MTSEYPTLKILNDTHWMFIRQSEGGQGFSGASGGPYRVEGNVYTETVTHNASPENIGNVYTFECRVEGDLWYHTGGTEGWRFDEVWRRVE